MAAVNEINYVKHERKLLKICSYNPLYMSLKDPGPCVVLCIVLPMSWNKVAKKILTMIQSHLSIIWNMKRCINFTICMYSVLGSLTPASIRSIVPVSRSTLSAVGSVDSGLTSTLTSLGVTRLHESCRGITVTLTTTRAWVEPKRAILKANIFPGKKRI